MKTIKNKSHELVTVEFDDGTAVFLSRFDTVDYDPKMKEVKRVSPHDRGIEVTVSRSISRKNGSE